MLVVDEPITNQPPCAGTPSLRGVGTQHPEVPRGPLLKMRGLGLCKAPWGMGTQALRAAYARGLWGLGPGRGSARENVVGLLPLKQRNRPSLPADGLLPEAGGMEGPALSFSLPVSAVGENSCSRAGGAVDRTYQSSRGPRFCSQLGCSGQRDLGLIPSRGLSRPWRKAVGRDPSGGLLWP